MSIFENIDSIDALLNISIYEPLTGRFEQNIFANIGTKSGPICLYFQLASVCINLH
jgi:hypothetical protein